MSVFILLIIVLVVEFLYTLGLNYLQTKSLNDPIPDVLSDVYTEEKYTDFVRYTTTNKKFSRLSNTFNFIFTLLFFILGGFGWMDEFVRSIVSHPLLQCTLFFILNLVIFSVISIPFNYYHTFVIEQKFGFNKTTHSTFIKDTIINILISCIITSGLMTACNELYILFPDTFWILGALVLITFSVIMQFIYSDVIVPLFNKQTPLPDGDLRNAIMKFAEEVGFKLDNIYVIDGSKRSTKANAYFTGFGSRKRVVLYDTLIEQMTIDEIVAVLAHEIGHYKNKHILKQLIISSIFTFILMFIFSKVINNQEFAIAAGASEHSFYLNMVIFNILLTPFTIITGMFSNIISRQHEYEADDFAINHGMSQHLVTGLKKLSGNSLSNLTPHPVVVFMEYSHPTLYERVKHTL